VQEKPKLEPLGFKWSLIWIVATIFLTGLSAVLGWAVNGTQYGFYTPLVSHGIQWIVCTFHAYPFQTEKYYDFMGAVTYTTLTLFTLFLTVGLTSSVSVRQIVASAFVLVWAFRLGSFLYGRIKRDGKDQRFDNLKPYFIAFFGTWNIQGTWCVLTGLSVWAVNTRTPADQPPFNWLDIVGIAIWVLGFGIEVVADRQKAAWRALPTSKGRYIDVGLWRYSRHPNYFGEFTLWLGQFVLGASAFTGDDAKGAFVGAGWLCVLSPIFVYCLLNYVSGVPILEKGSDKRWGHEEAYQQYKKETWVFWLLPTSRSTPASTPPAPAESDPAAVIVTSGDVS